MRMKTVTRLPVLTNISPQHLMFILPFQTMYFFAEDKNLLCFVMRCGEDTMTTALGRQAWCLIKVF